MRLPWDIPIYSCVFTLSNVLYTPNHTVIKGGAEVKGVFVSPTPELIRGDVEAWAKEAGVSCERIAGYWIGKQGVDIAAGAPPRKGEKILYSMHGGA